MTSISTHSEPRIALLGTGAIGTLMAWHWRALRPFVIRRDYSKPIRFQHADGTDTLDLPRWQSESLAWLVVTTKAADTLTALQSLGSELVGVKRILLLQNGMGQQDEVAAWIKTENLPCELWAGTSTEGAYTDEQGVVHYAGQGDTWAGCWGSETPEAALPPGVIHDPHIRQRLRAKLAINASINPLTALYRCRNGELVSNPQYRQHFELLAAEVDRLTQQLGWQLPFDVTEQASRIALATAENQSSTLQDILRHRPTELAYITEYLLHEAAFHNLPAPVLKDVCKRTSGGI